MVFEGGWQVANSGAGFGHWALRVGGGAAPNDTRTKCELIVRNLESSGRPCLYYSRDETSHSPDRVQTQTAPDRTVRRPDDTRPDVIRETRPLTCDDALNRTSAARTTLPLPHGRDIDPAPHGPVTRHGRGGTLRGARAGTTVARGTALRQAPPHAHTHTHTTERTAHSNTCAALRAGSRVHPRSSALALTSL